ncbi:MAG TPA: hypothetical protein VGF86_09760 [Candidatus Tumulicola sp.]|jgi:hypothetical protein
MKTGILCGVAVVALVGCAGAHPVPIAPESPAANRAAQTAPLLLVDPSKPGAVVSSAVLGANMATWYDVTQSGLSAAFKTAGLRSTRWPGGSESDNFHWETDSLGPGACGGGYVNANSTFEHFWSDIVHPARLDVAVTVNYGSNPACTGGADPGEAAGWVKYLNASKRYGLTWWSVGNEQYGSWETDLHSQPHDPSQYASLVASSFYPKMHAASPTPIDVCVDVDPDTRGWDATVLARAKYDCVELHYYPQGNTVDDPFLIEKAAPGLAAYLGRLKTELATAGRPKTPIYVGEIGSTYGTPGKQTMSITQALYAGQVVGELLKAGAARATWWIGYGGCNSESAGGDFSPSLYGWQDFGGYMIFSDGTLADGCSATDVPRGTLLPTARALQVASHFVRDGERMLQLRKTGLARVRAYATTYDGGYALMLFNLSQSKAADVPVKIAGKASGAGGEIAIYDRALYDASKQNDWKGPIFRNLRSWSGQFSVTLPPWSIVTVRTK